jgi:hypothetical protein
MSNLFALVDDDFYPYLSQFRWHAKPSDYTIYARRSVPNNKKIYMHQDIGSLVGLELRDHISLNGLDNRLENLRPATMSQNMANRPKQRNNSTGYKGVSPAPKGRYVARIKVRGTNFNLGYYSTPVEAAYAYNVAAKLLFGEFAYPNPIKVTLILNPLVADPSQLSAIQATAIEARVTERVTKTLFNTANLCQQVLQDTLNMP